MNLDDLETELNEVKTRLNDVPKHSCYFFIGVAICCFAVIGIFGSNVFVSFMYIPFLLCGGFCLLHNMDFARTHVSKWKMSDEEMQSVMGKLDESAGMLIKESEFRFWVEHFVNRERGKC